MDNARRLSIWTMFLIKLSLSLTHTHTQTHFSPCDVSEQELVTQLSSFSIGKAHSVCTCVYV